MKNNYSLENLKQITDLWEYPNKSKFPIKYSYPSCIHNPNDYRQFWNCVDEANKDIRRLSTSVLIPDSIQEKEDLLNIVSEYVREAALALQNDPPKKLLTPEDIWCLTYLSVWLSQYFARVSFTQVYDYKLNSNKDILENIKLYRNKADKIFKYISIISVYMLNN